MQCAVQCAGLGNKLSWSLEHSLLLELTLRRVNKVGSLGCLEEGDGESFERCWTSMPVCYVSSSPPDSQPSVGRFLLCLEPPDPATVRAVSCLSSMRPGVGRPASVVLHNHNSVESSYNWTLDLGLDAEMACVGRSGLFVLSFFFFLSFLSLFGFKRKITHREESKVSSRSYLVQSSLDLQLAHVLYLQGA